MRVSDKKRNTVPLNEDDCEGIDCEVQARTDKRTNGVWGDNSHRGKVRFDPSTQQFLCESCRDD